MASGVSSAERGRERTVHGGGSARYLRTHLGLLWRTTEDEAICTMRLTPRKPVDAGSPTSVLVYSITYVEILRIHLAGLDKYEYVIFIFSGLVPYLMAAEALSAGVSSVLANKAALNNTVFPIDLAPVKAVLTSQGDDVRWASDHGRRFSGTWPPSRDDTSSPRSSGFYK